MEPITIKLEEDLAKEMDKAMKPYYSTKTEFVREAIREKIQKINKEKVLEELMKNFGKAKKKTSYEEERRIRDKVGKEFIKKFGIKSD